MNTKLKKEARNDFEKDFFKLINNAVFGKTIENARKHRDIKLVTTNQLASEPNYDTTKYFSKKLMANEMKMTKVKMNKPIYLGMSISDISKTLMYKFWYDYIKPKYQRSCTKQRCTQDRAKLCYTDTESFIIHIKTEDLYKDIANDVEKWFDTFNYDENDNRPLPIGMNKKNTTKYFSKKLMANEMKMTKVKMNKPIYLGMSISDISKTLMYKFWYDYIKPKYQRSCTKQRCTQDRAKLCYTDTESFIIHIKTEDLYKDIANDVEKWFDTFNYDENDNRPLPIGMNKKSNWSF